MIRIDTIWLAIEPMDMRAGTETALARVIAVFGAARPHCAYLFANRRANRMKVLVHDGVGILRALAAQLIQRVETMGKQITHHKSVNEKLAHEIALLKRFKFAKRSEQLSPNQASLLDDPIDTDIAAIEAELEVLQPAPVEAKVRQQLKRAPLPSQFTRTLIHHEPDNSHCQCGCALKRIGEDASEKLDYTPGVFTVERHIRGKWACEQCESPRGSLCLGDRPSPRRWITASNAG
ncbi:IS66 family transposase zinc-finger binding domain-containing protein [Pseudomonas chlororaphis]|uniref:IS66 family transposase zinc-finger binding domain-containing protein n=1 Tax=Pseudomonas chlororaphis TaxID=587753 RepID=UPI00209A86FE|nr:IS66 family transposase zinc-finger binding domain-containing protein [Pseudomonas chlororaphis]MCO7613945.1 IS66 family transposase zinc-finger binding domain-containing protein [Pseudomonas chlororaphis]